MVVWGAVVFRVFCGVSLTGNLSFLFGLALRGLGILGYRGWHCLLILSWVMATHHHFHGVIAVAMFCCYLVYRVYV